LTLQFNLLPGHRAGHFFVVMVGAVAFIDYSAIQRTPLCRLAPAVQDRAGEVMDRS
jgi:hypothetical protein